MTNSNEQKCKYCDVVIKPDDPHYTISQTDYNYSHQVRKYPIGKCCVKCKDDGQTIEL